MKSIPEFQTFDEMLQYNVEFLKGERNETFYYAGSVAKDQSMEELIVLNDPAKPFRMFTFDGQGKFQGMSRFDKHPVKQRPYLSAYVEETTAKSLATFLSKHTEVKGFIVEAEHPMNSVKALFVSPQVRNSLQRICFTKRLGGDCVTGLPSLPKTRLLNAPGAGVPKSLPIKLWMVEIYALWNSDIPTIASFLLNNWNPSLVDESIQPFEVFATKEFRQNLDFAFWMKRHFLIEREMQKRQGNLSLPKPENPRNIQFRTTKNQVFEISARK